MLKQEGNKALTNIPQLSSQFSPNPSKFNTHSDSLSQASSAPTTSHSNKFNIQESTPKGIGMNEANFKVKLNQESKKRLSDFLDKFQGKVSMISKDGHLGVVARTGKPIEKVENLQNRQPQQQQALVQAENMHQNKSTSDIQQVDHKKDVNGKLKVIKSKFFKQNRSSEGQSQQREKQVSQKHEQKDIEKKKVTQQQQQQQQNKNEQQQPQKEPTSGSKFMQKPPIYQSFSQQSNTNHQSQQKQQQQQQQQQQPSSLLQSNNQLDFQDNKIFNNTYSINPMIQRPFPQQNEYHHQYQQQLAAQQQQPQSFHNSMSQSHMFHSNNNNINMMNNQPYIYSQRPVQPQAINLTSFNQMTPPHQQLPQVGQQIMQRTPSMTIQGPFPRTYRSNSIAAVNEPMHIGYQFGGGQQSMKNIPVYEGLEHNSNRGGYATPKSQFSNSKTSQFAFNSVGSQIMRKTDYQIISNKRLFSQSRGLGPANIGSDDWIRAKQKQDRMQSFFRQLKSEETKYNH